jgi:glycosyltransferase involved in cell wall biosynthesis
LDSHSAKPVALRDSDGDGLPIANHEDIKSLIALEFDAEFYRKKYRSSGSDADLLDEFCAGVGGGRRDPNRWFSTRHYVWVHADIRQSGMLPFYHYVLHGRRESRWIHAASDNVADDALLDDADPNLRDMIIIKEKFSDQFYRSAYADMVGPHSFPLEHYCVFGWHEGRDPNDWFSTKLYLKENSDVAEAGINPFAHYILYGQAEDRSAWPVRENRALKLKVNPEASWIENAELKALIAPRPKPLNLVHSPFCADQLHLHWVVPDFTIGSGGHMTIFRIIWHLEFAGHVCTIWIFNPCQHNTAEEYYNDIVKYFQPLRSQVHFCGEALWSATGDGIVATGWQTVSDVTRATGFKERFYFVQDHETHFHPTGSLSLAAELTYSEDLACICASPWLAELMSKKYRRWARAFWLAYDAGDYFISPDHVDSDCGRLLRIALYGRISTPRRCVELAFLALEHLAAAGESFEVHLFGGEVQPDFSRFPTTVHGVMNANELGQLYRTCDIGICFSATNYSLVPQEMMACGLPVIELNVPSTRRIFPEEVITLAGPHPIQIALDIKGLLHDSARRQRQREKALSWVAQFSWASAARSIYEALIERLKSIGHAEKPRSKKTKVRARSGAAAVPLLKASVCIPTFNGGQRLREVVDRIRTQKTPWPFEILLVDSGSTDGSTKIFKKISDIRYYEVEQKSFGHGRTRNMCMDLARGEFGLFLTQDSFPTDENWLYNMVSCVERYSEAAGGFGRHVACPEATPFVKRDISDHFRGLEEFPVALSRETEKERWQSEDPAWRQILHFFSDNNSCLRRSVWMDVPFPDCEYGEDQLWANSIIELGYQKIYVPSAAVFHSHNYNEDEIRQRASIEAIFFEEQFGYESYNRSVSYETQIEQLNRADRQWAKLNNVSNEDLNSRMIFNAARLDGYRIGSQKARLRKEQVGIGAYTAVPFAPADTEVPRSVSELHAENNTAKLDLTLDVEKSNNEHVIRKLNHKKRQALAVVQASASFD